MAAETTVIDSLDVRLAKIEVALPYLATKEDISDLRGELQSENAALRSELIEKIDAQGNELHGEIGALRSDMGALRSELIKKIDAQGNELHGEIGKMRGEMGKMNGEISEIRGELKTLRWSIALSVPLMGLVLGVLMFVLR